MPGPADTTPKRGQGLARGAPEVYLVRACSFVKPNGGERHVIEDALMLRLVQSADCLRAATRLTLI